MEEYSFLIDLTEEDKKQLASYSVFCDCLAAHLGRNCEIVLHSLGKKDDYIKKIINGNLSGRTSLTKADDYPVGAIEHLTEKVVQGVPPLIEFFSQNEHGIFRSANIGLVGEGNRLIGMICINFSLNAPLTSLLEMFTPPKKIISKEALVTPYSDIDYATIIRRTIISTKRAVMDDSTIPAKLKKKEIIRRLDAENVFDMKAAIAMCAEILEVRIATVYMHLRNLGKPTGSHSAKSQHPASREEQGDL